MAALAAVAVGGCTQRLGGSDQRLAPAPTRQAGTDPDVTLAARVLADERAMLDRVRATRARHPSLTGTLAVAEAAHAAHVRLLARAVPDKPTPAPAPTPTPTATTTRASHPVPDRPAPALGALARAEGRLSLAGRRSSFTAESGAFARVLASMAAAAAQQAATLAAAARDRP